MITRYRISKDEFDFDPDYFNKISAFIQQRENYYYSIAALTNEPEKLINHIKYYIDHRSEDDIDVEFNSLTETEIMYGATYTEFRTLEFFDGIIKWNEAGKTAPIKKFTTTEAPKILDPFKDIIPNTKPKSTALQVHQLPQLF